MKSKVLVAVLEPAATFRRGLEAALSAAGFKTETPVDPVAWAKEQPDRVVVATLRDRNACELLEAVAQAGAAAVALLPEAEIEAYCHALRHGAIAAVDWNAEPDEIVRVVSAAAAGQSLLPAELAQEFGKRGGDAHGPIIRSEEVLWLKALADGVSVVMLADEVGYSERSMFRRLHDLYGRLGVQNRAAAIVEAERLGLLNRA
jgi:DNA-binding NarL/FixJ family response regulator